MPVRARIQVQQAAVWTILMCVWAAASVAVAPAIGYGGTAFADDGVPPPLPYGGTTCVGPSPTQFAGVPWPVARMAPQRVWRLSRGEGETVAVVDSGVSRAAAGLAGAVLPGLDVVSGGAADSDCLGRGTALAGIVAARPTTGTGVVGMAPAVSVLPIRITDRSGRVPPDALARGISAAVTAGADIIVVGTGTTADSGALRTAVAAAVGNDVVVVAAINASQAVSGRPYEVWYPAAYEQVIAVGGVGMKGTPMVAAPATAGVDLLAPAEGAVSCGPAGNGHYVVGGPAVAAAYVAGAAALIRSYRPELTQAQVRERLELTAEHPPGKSRTALAGAGTIDPYAAVVDVAPVLGSRPVALPRVPVVLPTPPPADPVLRRASVVAGVIAAGAVTALAIAAIVRTRRRHGPS